MMSLLFLLFLISICLALTNREKASVAVYGIAMAMSLYWFFHHASSPLAIML